MVRLLCLVYPGMKPSRRQIHLMACSKRARLDPEETTETSSLIHCLIGRANRLTININGHLVGLRLVDYIVDDRFESGIFKKDIVKWLINNQQITKKAALDSLNSKKNISWYKRKDPLSGRVCELVLQQDLFPLLTDLVVAKPIVDRELVTQECLLIVDLDETLVHCVSQPERFPGGKKELTCISYHGEEKYYSVRPNASEIFTINAQLVIATKSVQDLAEIVVEKVLDVKNATVFGREVFGKQSKSLRAMRINPTNYRKIVALDDTLCEFIDESAPNFRLRNVPRYYFDKKDQCLIEAVEFINRYFSTY